MNEQIVELLRDKIDRVEAKVDAVSGDLKDIRGDVKEMLAFKWQIVGGSMVMSIIASVLFQVIINLWSR